jgi:DNA polymerase III subunit delta'
MIFPWQAQPWTTLLRLQQEQRVPHALLLLGSPGVGKLALAQVFAQRILCQNYAEMGDSSISCGYCHACHLMQAKSHPDFRLIQPEEAGHAIKIDQIRQLSDFIQNTSHQGGYRVVIIEPATAMNAYAANALLKTLEEPTPNTLIILISDQRQALPITITSRCQQMRIHTPTTESALAWLQHQDPTSGAHWPLILEATQGAPLLALEWQKNGTWPLYQSFIQDLCALCRSEKDPLQLAVQWKEANLIWIFDIFFTWLLKLLRVQQGFAQTNDPTVTACVPYVSLSGLINFATYLQKLRADALGPYNLNQQLLLESLFIQWTQHVSG